MSNFHLATKVLNYIDTRPKENEVKGAVKLDPDLESFLPTTGRIEQTAPVTRTAGNGGKVSTTLADIYATFDKQKTLSDFIGQNSASLGLVETPENYALMFEDRKRFVTELNKQLVQQGFYLMLTASPVNYARHFLGHLSSAGSVLPSSDQLSLFVSLCADPAFAKAFTDQRGVPQLVKFVEETAELHTFFDSNASPLFSLMQFLLTFMQHFPDLIPWSAFSPQFVHKIVVFVNGQAKLEHNDSRALALATLLILTERCDHLHECAKEKVKVDSLIRHLDNTDERISLDSLKLMNALYELANREERLAIVKTLHERPFLAAIGRVLEKTRRNQPSSSHLSTDQHELRQHLERLQQIRFDEIRVLSLRIPSDKEITYVLSGFAIEGGKTHTSFLEDGNIYENDEGSTHTSDLSDFRQLVRSTPPGSLAVCTILDFTHPPSLQDATSASLPTYYPDLQRTFAQIGRPYLWPLVLAKLVGILVRILGISGPLSGDGNQRKLPFWRLVLKNERPFNALFHILVILFQRTWDEMHAKFDDLPKVLSVVRDQLERAMAEDADSVEQLERELLRKRFSYFAMQKIWKREEMEKEELELAGTHIQPLREHLRPEFEQLVLQHRINFLRKGLTFQRVFPPKNQNSTSSAAVSAAPTGNSSSSNQQQFSGQFWFWRLDERQKYFHFWDCRLSGGKHSELALNTQSKLAVSKIKAVVHGAELSSRLSQHYGMKTHKKGQPLFRWGLCLEMDSSNPSTSVGGAGGEPSDYYLCAENETEFALWMDGLQSLLWPQRALQQAELREEVDRLLSLEIQIRLMDIQQLVGDDDEWVGRGNAPPPVPSPPTDFSWIPRAGPAN